MTGRSRSIVAAAAFVIAALFTPASASPVVVILPSWDGHASSTPCLCPVLEGLVPSATHAFETPVGGSLTVRITWTKDLIADLDLSVDRLVNGTWTQVGVSAGGQIANPSLPAAEEVVVASAPAGTYRARVANFLSTQTAYHGEASIFVPG